MKSVVILLVLAAFAAADWVGFGMDGVPSAELTVLESDASGMVIELVTPGMEVNPFYEQGILFHSMAVPGAVPNAGGDGHPAIPSVSFMAALPSRGIASITVEDASWMDLGLYNPAPMQPIPADDSYEPVPFTFVPSAYTGTLPSSQVSWRNDGVLRGVNTGVINVSPLRWNAETGVLQASPRMIVRIEYAGSVQIDDRLHSRF